VVPKVDEGLTLWDRGLLRVSLVEVDEQLIAVSKRLWRNLPMLPQQLLRYKKKVGLKANQHHQRVLKRLRQLVAVEE
jgi:hypothetical protein